MDFQIPNFLPAVPELALAGIGVLALLAVSFAGRRAASVAFALTQFGLLVAAMLILLVSRDFGHLTQQLLAQLGPADILGNLGQVTLAYLVTSSTTQTFGQMFIADPLGDVLGLATCITVATGLVYGRHYLRERALESAEFYLLVLFAALGILVMISAASLLSMYVGLELLSLASYALVAIHRDSVRSTEAAMKYFVLGALASGLLLYGMSMLYGATQSLDLVDIASALSQSQGGSHSILLFGLVFLVAGVAFKLGVVPFHMWIPDVYEGAPTPVTLFIASASKLAAFAMACRLLAMGLPELILHWKLMLMFAGACSVILGNLAAIAQSNLKRMLAYSGISHMGFMILGFSAVSPLSHGPINAYASGLFYMLTYVLASLGAFGVMLVMARQGNEAEEIRDFAGLNRRSSWWAWMMALCMFSMAGIPAFAGFFGKFFVLQALWVAGYPGMALLAVAMSLIGAYYYLRIVKVMFFDPPAEKIPDVPAASAGQGLLLSCNVLLLVVLGLLPGVLMELCVQVVQSLPTDVL